MWVKSDELLRGTEEGTYLLADAETAARLSFASEIIVIDAPGKMLYWDDATGVAFDWTRPASELASEPEPNGGED